jgi:hypothetical protein
MYRNGTTGPGLGHDLFRDEGILGLLLRPSTKADAVQTCYVEHRQRRRIAASVGSSALRGCLARIAFPGRCLFLFGRKDNQRAGAKGEQHERADAAAAGLLHVPPV